MQLSTERQVSSIPKVRPRGTHRMGGGRQWRRRSIMPPDCWLILASIALLHAWTVQGDFTPKHQPAEADKWVYPSEQQYYNAMKVRSSD